MIPPQVLGAISQIMDAANALQKIHDRVADVGKVSVAAYASKTILTSRAYIDRSVAYEPITKDILQAIHKLWTAMILNALQMNRLVTKDKTVQDLLNVIATEDFVDYEDIAEAFEAFSDFDKIAQVHEGEAAIRDKKRIHDEQKRRDHAGKDKHDKDAKQQDLDETLGEKPSDREHVSGREIELDTTELPVGKVFEVTLTNPENKEANVKLNLMVQILPYIVSEAISYKLLTLDAKPTVWQRLLQLRAGEISFWKDFCWSLDQVKNTQKALKEDENGVLQEYFGVNRLGQQMKLVTNLNKDANERARNIANTILIITEDTVKQAKAMTGFDLHRADARSEFFGVSLTMVIVIVDTMYNHVTMYFNGLKDGGTYTFDQFKSASKKGDSALDIISAMSAFSRGTAPKF